ncbi:N-acetyltransferase [Pseudonocardia spinosispora]|uniref:N-acetyltransferase n=1 Tax=Pseudonocardia spinosispora TaxID=103441 RepID=UPI000422AE6C|nr:N-acetyltransferase [Pseudonocardia spinosispora]
MHTTTNPTTCPWSDEVITYTWYGELPADHVDELRRMLRDSAVEDDEAGFPKITVDGPYPAGCAHLLVWLVPDERPGAGAPTERPRPILAAYLRVEPEDGVGFVRFVVRPELRSKGIATLLFEQLGFDLTAPDGWAGTGVSALYTWARGDHPAADRISSRFSGGGVRRTHREWQLLAPLRGDATRHPDGADVRPFEPGTDGESLAVLRSRCARAAPDREVPPELFVFVAPGTDGLRGAVSVDPDAGQRTDFGTAGRIAEILVDPDHADGPVRPSLLGRGLDCLREKGLRVAGITVDSADRELVRDCRLIGFMHDRTDAEYRVTSARSPRNAT